MVKIRRWFASISAMRTRVAPRLVLLMLATLFAGGRARAQEDAIPPDSLRYNLPEIVVTTSPVLLPSANIVREANVADFEALNAHTVGEALTHVPGVSLQTGTAGDAHVAIRGFRHRDVLILFDGIPIASVFEGAIDLHEVSINQVATIKTIKGAPSVIYGTNAVAGVIEIIPRTGEGEAFAGLEVGEDEYRWLRGSFGRSTRQVDYFAAANYETAGRYSLSDGFDPDLNQSSDLRSNSDFERRNVLAHMRARSRVVGTTSLLLSASDQERGFTPQVGIDDPDFARLTDSSRLTLGLSNDFASVPASLRLYYNRYHSAETAYTDSTYSVIDEVNEGTDRAVGATLYSRLVTTPSNLLIVSLAYQGDAFENRSDPEAVLDVDARTYTIAAEDEIVLQEKVTVALGGLLSRFDELENDRSLSALNAQVVLGYQASQELAFHGSAARRTRFPKLRELYRERFGNLDLQEQVANNYELGVKHVHSSGVQSDAAVFLSQVDGLIDRFDRQSPYENLEDITFKGFEAASGGWLSERVFGRAGYTYVHANEELPDGSARQLRRIPRHTVTADLRYRFPRNVLASLNAVYVADLFDLDPEDVHTQLSDYVVVGLKTSVDLVQNLSAYVAVSNVNDENYVNRLGFPLEGRTLRLGAEVSF